LPEIRGQSIAGLRLFSQSHAPQQIGKSGVATEIFERGIDLQKRDILAISFRVSFVEPFESAVLTLTQIDSVTINGMHVANFTHTPAYGTYTVNPDCTGNFTIVFTDGATDCGRRLRCSTGWFRDRHCGHQRRRKPGTRHPQYQKKTFPAARLRSSLTRRICSPLCSACEGVSSPESQELGTPLAGPQAKRVRGQDVDVTRPVLSPRLD
jgi:hypothetical protein